jgi:chaperonin cofactor prefoldin
MATLYELTGQYRELLELAESEELDKQLIADTLEGLDGEFEIKADGYAKVIRELEGKADLLKNEIERLSKRKSAIENNIKSMKEALQNAMFITGKTKFKTDLFNFNIQKNPPRLVIDKPEEVPEEYLIPQEPKIDTSAIKEALKRQELPFAHLEQSESLRIR